MKKLLLTLFAWCWLTVTFAQLTLIITNVPPNTPAGDSIYIAGNFNNWNPGAPSYIVQKQPNGTRQIILNPPTGQVEFKFTRGSWATVEGTVQGAQRPNRVASYNGQAQTLQVTIDGWENVTPAPSTAAANVRILSQDFFMPQLNRTRRIWIYLPPNYESSNNRYPVLYLHDAQNIFDASTSFSGEWKVDEALNTLFQNGDKGVIAVAVDNGGASRLNEYSPWVNARYGGGEGEKYVQFIVETLKPYIDATYRTKPQREYTGIMGSSMGGLISMYAAIEHQDIFSKAGIFSPAFWFAPQCYTHVNSIGKRADMRIYLLAGAMEDNGSVVSDINAMYNTLRNAGFGAQEVKVLTHPDGQHSEWYWAREFPAAYQWLFSNTTSRTRNLQATTTFSLSPNPTDSILWVRSATALPKMDYRIFYTDGQEIQPLTPLQNEQINVANLPAGAYIVIFYKQNQVIESRKIIVR